MSVAAALLTLVWGARPLPMAPQGGVTLEGLVQTDRGQTVAIGASLRLENSSGELVAEQPLPSGGRYEFPTIARGFYRLTVTAEGFQTYRQDLDLTRAGPRVVINVLLSPLPRAKPAPGPLPALTDLAAPKKARQEHARGARALEARKLAEAQSRFEKAVEEYPCYARAQTNLALVLSAQNEHARAEAALRKAIDCDPDYLTSRALLGMILNGQKKFAESEKVLQEGLRRFPSAWQLHYQLGAAHFGRGQYAKAEEEYLKARSLNPEPPAELHAKLADVYLATKSYTQAYAEMQAYLRGDPNGRFAVKIRTIMQEMESSGVLGPR